MTRFHLILLMFFLFISGCAQKISPPKQQMRDWKVSLQSQSAWQASGKLAFISDTDRQSANFNWHYENGKQHLILTSFIGTRILSLKELAQHSELQYDGNTYFDTNSQQLVKRLSGLDLPVAQAPAWLTGTVDNPTNQYDDQARLTSSVWTDENGQLWQAQYQQFNLIEGMWLPTRMNLSHNKLRIKIQLNSWQF
ncbi:lipoprotein insertase outer membrane protein LolB [Pseudoalteromonas sp. A25]|uniref:lipoprotein insertase outer membrane protein LolB n=1 Tax=Pseudoalteromonas sp. A25 TaxID=116092 RepID=UPI001E54C173|nr:lipoprotein insertase outer membrane protein LolB [Pseudoalteromonas sp. A25]